MNDTRTKVDAIKELGEKITGKTLDAHDTIVEMIDEITKNYEGSSQSGDFLTIDTTQTLNSYYEARFRDFITDISFESVLPADISYLFASCKNLVTVSKIDLSNCNKCSSIFKACAKLKTINIIGTQKAYTYQEAFAYSTALEDVPFLDMSNVRSSTDTNNMFLNCSNLTNDSLNNILASLNTINVLSGTYGTLTLQNIGLSSTQATVCTTLSNWGTLSTKGWTTGY